MQLRWELNANFLLCATYSILIPCIINIMWPPNFHGRWFQSHLFFPHSSCNPRPFLLLRNPLLSSQIHPCIERLLSAKRLDTITDINGVEITKWNRVISLSRLWVIKVDHNFVLFLHSRLNTSSRVALNPLFIEYKCISSWLPIRHWICAYWI